MIRIKVCVQLFWFFLILQTTKSKKEDYEVELVQVVFRHGDRTPTKSELYKKLAYNPIYDSLGYGQLTEVSTYYILIIHKVTFSMKYSNIVIDFLFLCFFFIYVRYDFWKLI
ncbi:uncharacterized protein LOC112213283 [Bombus impatiens]|uniref:Uncharacterized protein LOC112213283 n=1 Tax=Bombus impatiens TaxID=132113 RepID=A0A6P6FDJ3_BOMIM|nr:uncharacterized protein LOC112213283 [Bombus impatiens]